MCNWDEFNNRLKECEIESGYAVIMLTDEVRVSRYNGRSDNMIISEDEYTDRLLDMRIFDNECELRIFRGDVGREFSCRVLKNDGSDMFDDYQVLEENKMEALFGKEKIKIVNHIAYDECGQAYISDWRLADFMERGV